VTEAFAIVCRPGLEITAMPGKPVFHELTALLGDLHRAEFIVIGKGY
jgi:hypothetical protein